MNNVMLVGNVTKDIELAKTKTGKTIAQFSIGIRRNENTSDFPYCVAWGRTAEVLHQYCHKGSKIAVEGSIQTSSYEVNGKRSYRTIVAVSRIELLGSKDKAGETPAENTTYDIGGDLPELTGDELPF